MTKNSIHYSGITPEDDINGESSTVIEMGQPTCHRILEPDQSVTSPQSYKLSWTRLLLFFWVCIGSIVIIWTIFARVLGDGNSMPYRSVVTLNDGFDMRGLKPLLINDSDNENAVLGSSSYPAILLYRYDKSGEIFGHIPHEWVNNEEPFLMVDQITMGVGESMFMIPAFGS